MKVGANNAPATPYSIVKIQGEEWLVDDKGLPVYPIEPFDWSKKEVLT